MQVIFIIILFYIFKSKIEIKYFILKLKIQNKQASSQEERDSWVEALKQAMVDHKRKTESLVQIYFNQNL